MTEAPRQYVFLGLTITSTWGNGHATTYRALLKELSARGHSVTFLERDMPWYAENRELRELPYCKVELYASLEELQDCYSRLLSCADAVVVGSYVPEGAAVGRWAKSIARRVLAFYDIDTPVTLTGLREQRCEYLTPELVPEYDLYLSFTGGPTLEFIERRLGSPCARPLYCSVDPAVYFPEKQAQAWDLAYLGTYAEDRQPALEKLMVGVAERNPSRKFVVAGPQYPAGITWPENVERIEHLRSKDHRLFYNSQAFALNLTRQDMIRAGYSPSVRLFEAAACGVPILTDEWPGLDQFFRAGAEILVVRSELDVSSCLSMNHLRRQKIAEGGRRRTLRCHTASVRAAQFDSYIAASLSSKIGSNSWARSVVKAAAPALLEN